MRPSLRLPAGTAPLRLLGCLLLAGPAAAQTPLAGVEVVGGLARPTSIAAPAGDARIFVTEQHTARVRIVEDGVLLPTPFLDLQGQVAQGSEQGLLGLAFHPDYSQNGFFFVQYTDPVGTVVVARYQVSAGDPDVADPASGSVVLTQAQPFVNHNGGDLKFGPLDGYLYVPLGDGGDANDPFCNAQSLDTWLGKTLRIDVDGGAPYAVPADNPFVGVPGALPEIWNYGLRAPWRASFDRLTGDLYIGDVGQNYREEIDFEPALTGGRNYGWKIMESDLCNEDAACAPGTPACFDAALTDPIHIQTHTGFFGPCAIIGGFVYRGCAIPDLAGHYFFADHCTGNVWSFTYDGSSVRDYTFRTLELTPPGGTLERITTFGEDGLGELYLATRGSGSDGTLVKIVPATPPAIVDCDGDGRDDDCQLVFDVAADLVGDGVLDACQAFSADTAELSISLGGTQTMSLHAGPSHGGSLYGVLGSLAGTSPGFPVGAFVLPLNFDFYTNLTILNPNDPPLVDSFGNLDVDGNGTALFELPAGFLAPTLVGTTVSHAYLLFDGSLQVSFTSNPIQVELGA